MFFKSLSKTTNQPFWRHKTHFNYLIVAALVALVIFVFAAQDVASAQGPPSSPVSGNALGNSPFANYGQSEVPITVKGVLTILHGDDFANKRGKVFYFLKNLETNETLELRFANKAPGHLLSGSVVTVRGKAKGRELYLALDETGPESIETVLPTEVVVSGEQQTIVMVVNFRDANVSCSMDEIQELMFNDPFESSVDDYYQEASVGNIWFNGDVVGPYTINYSSTGSCDTSAWAMAAEAAARTDGVDLNAYNRKIYVMPNENSCGWAGLASLGGNPSRAWIFLCDSEDVFAHELGHNLGMNHAAIPTYDYGDVSDVMGLSGYGLRWVNSPHMEQMGWLPSDRALTVTENGLYDVASLETSPYETMMPLSLKIAKPDTGEYYYLSYRQPVGFDTNLSPYYLGGLNIHRYKGDGSASRTYFLDKIEDGESYADQINGINIVQVSHTDNHVTVQINFNNSCVTAAPVVNISPDSQNATPGTTLDYTVIVTNTDHTNCGASNLSLSASLPEGWTGALSPENLSLTPGQEGTATLSVTSPDVVTEASYGLRVNVTDAVETTHSAFGSASYVIIVLPGDTESPSSPTGLSAKVKGKNVSLSWSGATDNLGVIGYTVWRDGIPIGNVVAKTSFLDNTVGKGTTYTYQVEAYDEAGNTSALSNQITITVKK